VFARQLDTEGGDTRILNEGSLHDADQRFPIRRQRQTLHALIGGAPACVGARFDGALRGLKRDGEIARQIESLDQLPGRAIELPHVRSVFVGDENGLSVVGDANRLGIEARVRGHRGSAGTKIVRPAGEIEFVRCVLRRSARTDAKAGAGSVGERRRAVEQRGLG